MNTSDISRRTMLGIGGAALLAGSSGTLNRTHAATLAAKRRIAKRATAERVIFFWLGGGLSQIDTWDPKPGRPSQGEFTPIATSVPGISITEIFPRLATQMHHCTLVRSLVGRYDQHLPATTHLQTGREPSAEIVHPGIGSVCARAWNESGRTPGYVSISGRAPSPGWLGDRYAADFISSPEDAMSSERIPISASGSSRYGDTTFGRATLLARLLIERGTRFVHVYRGGFDTHANAFHTLRTHGDVMDQPLAALLEDLAESGLLATTVVVLLSEFGRSPRVNSYAGRDHWSECFSCLLAGGGFTGGTVIGESDRDGYRPATSPMEVGELHSTIYRALGIAPPLSDDRRQLA
jgi:hypothetical protein